GLVFLDGGGLADNSSRAGLLGGGVDSGGLGLDPVADTVGGGEDHPGEAPVVDVEVAAVVEDGEQGGDLEAGEGAGGVELVDDRSAGNSAPGPLVDLVGDGLGDGERSDGQCRPGEARPWRRVAWHGRVGCPEPEEPLGGASGGVVEDLGGDVELPAGE